MCMYQGALTSKKVTLASMAVGSIVQSDSQCRACFDVNKPDKISDLQRDLLDYGCIAESDTCRYNIRHSSGCAKMPEALFYVEDVTCSGPLFTPGNSVR